MSVSGIIYALIGYKDIALAEYSEFKGEFQKICREYLSKIDSNSSGGYKINDYFLFYINENNISYMIMTDPLFSKDTAIMCLENIQKEFTGTYNDLNFEGKENFCINKEFKPKLKMSYEYYNEHRDELNGAATTKLKEEMFKMKDDILDAYGLLEDRGGLLEAVNTKAEKLEEKSKDFHRAAKKVNKSESHKKVYLIVGTIVAVLFIGYLLISIATSCWTLYCPD